MPLPVRSFSSPCFAAGIPFEPEAPPGKPAQTPPYHGEEEEGWSRMLPEILLDISRRVEASEERWPERRSVVAFACVCRRWRRAVVEVVRPLSESGRITFPSSLKEPGPKQLPIQCFIKRNRKDSTIRLYLSLTQAFFDQGKFLLAARRFRYGGHAEYVISLAPNDYSQGSQSYVGKLRSDFLGTKFTLFDSSLPQDVDLKSFSHLRTSRRFSPFQVSPQYTASNFEAGEITYRFNLMKSRLPRRMFCTLQYPDVQKPTEGNNVPAVVAKVPSGLRSELLILKNKSPRWHEHLQCWCLNFHGRVTIASVKNFQLVALAEPGQPIDEAWIEEPVLLQFGKVGDDLFTMDYRQPLSAFQAFAICLTSFGTKFACE